MPRPNTGEVTEWLWKDARTITYGARIHADGSRYRLTFGTSHEGWDRTRAETELERILQEVDAGIWIAPLRKTSAKKAPIARPDGHQLFSSFARQTLDAKKNHGLAGDVIADLDWRLGHLIDHLGRLELLEINVAWVDGFRDGLAKRSKFICDTAARGKPLTRTVTTKHGAPYKQIVQPLSNESINEMLTLLSEIMQRAVDYGYVAQNPLKVGKRNDRFLPTP
jgi:hypothetical protein